MGLPRHFSFRKSLVETNDLRQRLLRETSDQRQLSTGKASYKEEQRCTD
jgi:hypothetical protein